MNQPPSFGNSSQMNQPPPFGNNSHMNQPIPFNNSQVNQPPLLGNRSQMNQPPPQFCNSSQMNQPPPQFGNSSQMNQPPPQFGNSSQMNQPPPQFGNSSQMNQPPPQFGNSSQMNQPPPPQFCNSSQINQPPPPQFGNSSQMNQPPPPQFGNSFQMNQQPPPLQFVNSSQMNQPPPFGNSSQINQPPPPFGNNSQMNQPIAIGNNSQMTQSPSLDNQKNQPTLFGNNLQINQPPPQLGNSLQMNPPSFGNNQMNPPPFGNSQMHAPPFGNNQMSPPPFGNNTEMSNNKQINPTALISNNSSWNNNQRSLRSNNCQINQSANSQFAVNVPPPPPIGRPPCPPPMSSPNCAFSFVQPPCNNRIGNAPSLNGQISSSHNHTLQPVVNNGPPAVRPTSCGDTWPNQMIRPRGNFTQIRSSGGCGGNWRNASRFAVSSMAPRGGFIPNSNRMPHQNAPKRMIDTSTQNDNIKKQKSNDKAPGALFNCDTCDRGFQTEILYKEHVAGHEKCRVKGCSYVAAPKLVKLHFNTQHRTNLASKIWQLESTEDIAKWREQRKQKYPRLSCSAYLDKKPSGDVCQNEEKEKVDLSPRTSIVSEIWKEDDDTLDGCSSWLAERKRNFPSKENCRKKAALEREKKERGEMLVTATHGKMRKRMKAQTSCEVNTENSVISHTVISSAESSDSDINSTRHDIDDTSNAIPEVAENITESIVISDEANFSPAPAENETLLDAGIELATKEEDEEQQDSPCNESGWMQEAEEEKQNSPCGESQCVTQKNEKQTSPCSKSQCMKEKEERQSPAASKSRRMKGRRNKNNRQKAKKTSEVSAKKRRSSLLNKLLAADIRHERNVILQCIRYIVKNNFFETTQPDDVAVAATACDQHSVDTSNMRR